MHLAGRVPKAGATLHVDGLKLIVRDADATRVVKVEIVEERGKRSPSLPEAPAG